MAKMDDNYSRVSFVQPSEQSDNIPDWFQCADLMVPVSFKERNLGGLAPESN